MGKINRYDLMNTFCPSNIFTWTFLKFTFINDLWAASEIHILIALLISKSYGIIRSKEKNSRFQKILKS